MGAAEPEWTNIGPAGQAINAIGLLRADHSNRSPARVVLYAGTPESGIFRSSDQGATWIAVNNGLTDLGISSLAFHNREIPSRAPMTRYETVIYAGTYSGVFRSIDGGGSWTPANAGLGFSSPKAYALINSLATHPSGDVFVSTSQGAFKSSDRGDSWVPINAGKGEPAYALAIDPRPPVAVYASLDKKLLKSVDEGQTWTDILPHPGLGFGFIAQAIFIDPFSATILLPGLLRVSDWQALWEGCQYKSRDGGQSWISLSEIRFGDVVFLDESTALAAVTFRILPDGYASDVVRSTDGGATWQPMNAGLPISQNLAAVKLASDPVSPGTAYAATTQGVFRSGPLPDQGLPRVVPKRQSLSSPVADR